MTNTVNKALQQKLAEFKAKSGMNQTMLARGIGVSPASISMYLNDTYAAKCGGLLVFAQIISNIKKRRNLLKTWISAFLCLGKSCISFFTKPRGNARFFVESCRVLIGF